MNPIPLSKTLFKAGNVCSKRMYFKAHDPQLAGELSADIKARIEVGQRAGTLARELWPEGQLIDARGSEAVQLTQEAIPNHLVIFEAAFQVDGYFAQIDVLEKLPSGGWHLLEVKGNSGILKDGKVKSGKQEVIEDVTFQVRVARLAGLQIEKVSLVHFDKTFLYRGGPVIPGEILATTEITSFVDKADELVEVNARLMKDILNATEVPEVETNRHCFKCDFYDHCHPNPQNDDLVFLPRVDANTVSNWRKQGYDNLRQVPVTAITSDSATAETQRRALKVLRNKYEYISEDLTQVFRGLPYPWVFIDFEAFGPAFPRYPNTSPFAVIPFQWSCHTRQRENGKLTHTDFLHVDASDPRAAFAASLHQMVKNAGTIFTYSDYERARINSLADIACAYGDELSRLLAERECDLLKIIREHVYFEQFRGSLSIKAVLPAIVPGLDYKDLAIQEGGAAARIYENLLDSLGTEMADQLAKDLRAYCERDTFAMVKIVDSLIKLKALGQKQATLFDAF